MENKHKNLLCILITQTEDGKFRFHYTLKNGTTGSPSCIFDSLQETLKGIEQLERQFR